MKTPILLLILPLCLFSSNMTLGKNDTDLSLNIINENKEVNLERYSAEIEKFRKQTILNKPDTKSEIGDYFRKLINKETNQYYLNELFFLLGQYIEDTEESKICEKYYENLLFNNKLLNENLPKVYLKLMSISYERLGYNKANYYFKILNENFKNTVEALTAKKNKINFLIKEKNYRTAYKYIIKQLAYKNNNNYKLFLLTNLLEINLLKQRTENTEQILLNINNLLQNRTENQQETIEELGQINILKESKEVKKNFFNFYTKLFNEQDFYNPEVVKSAYKFFIKNELKQRNWLDVNKKILELFNFSLTSEEFKEYLLIYDVTLALNNVLSVNSIRTKYIDEKNKNVLREVKEITTYIELKDNTISYILENFKKLVSIESKILKKYGLKKGNLIDTISNKLFFQWLYNKKKENYSEVIANKFIKKYGLIKELYNKLKDKDKLLLLRKIINNNNYSIILEDLLNLLNYKLKEEQNLSNMDYYLLTLIYLKKEEYTKSILTFNEIDRTKLVSKEQRKYDNIFIDLMIKYNNQEQLLVFLERYIQTTQEDNKGVIIDNLWKSFLFLTNKLNPKFEKIKYLIKIINLSNTNRLWVYRPEIDYALFEEIKKNDDKGSLEILLNIERNKYLFDTLNENEKEELFYKIGNEFLEIGQETTSSIYYEMCLNVKNRDVGEKLKKETIIINSIYYNNCFLKNEKVKKKLNIF